MKPILYDYYDTPLQYVLDQLGYTSKLVRKGPGSWQKQIYDYEGVLLFTGNAGEVWEWLRKTGRATPRVPTDQ